MADRRVLDELFQSTALRMRSRPACSIRLRVKRYHRFEKWSTMLEQMIIYASCIIELKPFTFRQLVQLCVLDLFSLRTG